jgi:hypothetical protein
VLARSTVSVDQPLAGRPTAVVLGLMVALIACLTISVATARASDDSQVAEQSSDTTQSATATASPATAEANAAPAASTTPAQPETEPVADEPAQPAAPPAGTEVPATGDEPTEPEAPAEEPAEQPPVTTSEPTESGPDEAEPTEPAPVVPPSASATAQNTSQTWQAVFQVQQGCKSYCQGTSQSQSANQVAETIQSATAIGGGTGSPSSATALNQSTTGQFIWQVQLGCVAFCYGTSQSQTASQWASTTQNATALSDGNAQAHNVGSTMQQVWQLQFGCQVECYGNSQTQSSTQGQSTNQSATATSETWATSYPTDPQSLLVPAWLIALAENLGITIQTSWQYQEASCLEHCVGDSQSQAASQNALTSQEARAVAGIPPEEPKPPVAETPPAAEPTPAVAAIARASSDSAQSFVESATATWRRVSGDGVSGSRVHGRSSVTTSSGSGGGLNTETRFGSSARMAAGSSAKEKTTTSASTSSTSSTDFSSVRVDPLSGLGESNFGFGPISWLLIGLLMVFGIAILRKTHLRSPAV